MKIETIGRFAGQLLISVALVMGIVYGTRYLDKTTAPAPTPSAMPVAPRVDYSIGECRDGAIKIHDDFVTCPHPSHAVRVRSSSIVVCVCKSSNAPDPEAKTEDP